MADCEMTVDAACQKFRVASSIKPQRSAAEMPEAARSESVGALTSARGRKRRDDGLSTR